MKIIIENANFTNELAFNDFIKMLKTLRQWGNTEIVLNNVRFIKK